MLLFQNPGELRRETDQNAKCELLVGENKLQANDTDAKFCTYKSQGGNPHEQLANNNLA